MSASVNLSWEQLTPEVMTSLFLYGTMTPPEVYNDRIRPQSEGPAIVTLDMASFMSTGPGRYALACNAPFVQTFFAFSDDPIALGIPPGSYTAKQLMELFGIPADQFSITFQHYAVDSGSEDYAARTYIYNTCSFKLSDDTRFVFEAGNYHLENLSIRAYHDNFDFSSESWIASIGNSLLHAQIDPYDLAQSPVRIFLQGNGSPIQSIYSHADYNAELAYWSDICNPVSNLGGLYGAMSGVISQLKNSGTIEYEKDGKDIVYGSPVGGDDDVLLADQPSILVGGVGNDLLIGNDDCLLMGGDGADYLLASGGAVTLDGGAGNDYLEATGDGPVTYIFGRGSGHDVLGSLWPAPGVYADHNPPAWWEQRQNDKVLLKDLSLSDISFVWDNDIWIDVPHHITGTTYIRFRQGGLSIVINDTGESLFLGTVYAESDWDPWTGEFKHHFFNYDEEYITSGPIWTGPYRTVVEGQGQINTELSTGPVWKFIQFADGTTYGIEDLIDLHMPASEMPASYTSALDEYMAGSSGPNNPSGGTAGPDGLEGTSGSDRLVAGDGNDTLIGADGDDIMLGGLGNDFIVSGQGDTGNDYINGGLGTDTVMFANAAEGVTINLTDGFAVGDETGTDILVSIENAIRGSGDDIIIGTDLDNRLTGDNGNDSLFGGAGDDSLIGGNGSDTLWGGDGIDATTYTASPAGVAVNLSLGVGIGGDAEGDVLSDIENITGSMFCDVLIGSSAENYLLGLAGNDTLDSGTGADTLEGGVGDDTYLVSSIEAYVIEADDEGFDTVYSSVSFEIWSSIEVLVLTGTSAIDGTGSYEANVLIGNSNDNTLDGMGGADTLDGGNGTDTVSYEYTSAGVSVSLATGMGYGGDAEGDVLISIENLRGSWLDDTLEGSAGNNVLTGGSGVDTVSYAHATAAVTVDLALSTAQNTAGAGIDTLIGFENTTGSAYADFLKGSNGANILAGGAGNDTLMGGLGSDTLDGGEGIDIISYRDATSAVVIDLATGAKAGNTSVIGDVFIGIECIEGTAYGDQLSGDATANVLIGNAGNDIAKGADGNDTLNGGAGNDTLTGGLNSDTFIFTPGFGADVITDFDAGAATDDVIEFSTTLFANFAAVQTASIQSGSNVVITASTGNTITLQNVMLSNLHADDFRFV